ncbi:MAG: hypothetical protein ACXWUG_07410 [Polyangiales bacterium]
MAAPRSASAQVSAPPSLEPVHSTKERPHHLEEDLIGTPRVIPVAPRAPTLPDLTHPEPEMEGEHTIASVAPKAGTLGPADHARLSAHLFHFETEVPLARFLYVGGAWAFAAARGATDDSVHVVPGQPEIFARVVRALEGESYDIGAGLAVLPPLARYDDLAASERLARSTAASLVSVVRPWDVSMFLDRRVTAKPWVDLRTKNRRLIAQFRQALDVGYRVSTTPCVAGTTCDEAGDLQVMAISTLYLGWQPTRELTIGVEAWEIYLLKTQLLVNDRAALALSPSIRFYFRWVEPSVSVLLPLGPTLFNAADGYYALRLDMRVWFGGR